MNPLLETDYDAARRMKYEAGRQEHRDGTAGEFVGCPVEEFYLEMLDAGNYLDEMRSKGIDVPPFLSLYMRCAAAWARKVKQCQSP